VAYQEALKYLVQEEQKLKAKYFVIHEIKSSIGKEIRIRGLLGMYQNRVIFHRKGLDTSYELELLAFPRGRRDDRADCMAFLQTALDTHGSSGIIAKVYKPRWTGYGRKT
jgi:phage terminase large subunit-like protein